MTISEVIQDLIPGAQFSISGDSVDNIDWHDTKNAQPSKQEILDHAAVLDARVVAEEYKSKRKAEYPSIGDQLDAIHKKLNLGDSSDYDAIATQIEAVKTKHPKPQG